MSEVVTQAVLPWRIDRRHMFPRGIAPRLIVLLLVQRRLQRQAEDFALALGRPSRWGIARWRSSGGWWCYTRS